MSFSRMVNTPPGVSKPGLPDEMVVTAMRTPLR